MDEILDCATRRKKAEIIYMDINMQQVIWRLASQGSSCITASDAMLVECIEADYCLVTCK